MKLIPVLVLAMFFAAPCLADSFGYSVSESVFQIDNGSLVLLGALNGGFSISTTGVPFNYPGAYFCDGPGTCPLVTSASLTWTPTGGTSEPLSISPYLETLIGASSGFNFATPCSFATGAQCNFQLLASSSNIGGLLNFGGFLGQNLTMGLCAGCMGSSYPNFFVDYQGTAVDPVATPEPGTLLLIVTGLVLGIPRAFRPTRDRNTSRD